MAKTLRQLITSVRSNLAEKKAMRYVTGTTTSAGNAGGTTLIDSGLSSYLDTHFVGCVANLTSGTSAGHKQPLISIFVASTGTVTMAETIGVQVGSSVTYEIMEAGQWTDRQIIDALNGEQDEILEKLSDEALINVATRGTTAGTAGVGVLPTGMIRPITVLVDSVVAGVLNVDEENRFYNDPFLPGTTNHPVGLYSGRSFLYRPANNATLTWSYIGRLAELSSSQSTELPDHYADLLVLLACKRLFAISEDFDSMKAFKILSDERLQAINAQFGNTRTKQLKGA